MSPELLHVPYCATASPLLRRLFWVLPKLSPRARYTQKRCNGDAKSHQELGKSQRPRSRLSRMQRRSRLSRIRTQKPPLHFWLHLAKEGEFLVTFGEISGEISSPSGEISYCSNKKERRVLGKVLEATKAKASDVMRQPHNNCGFVSSAKN